MEEKKSLKKQIISVCIVVILIIIATISIFFIMDNKNEVIEEKEKALNVNNVSRNYINVAQRKQSNIIDNEIVNEVVKLDNSKVIQSLKMHYYNM